ncbi:hypothetical protein K474DRAFT_1714364 [Panus rudis PR-1116 ss-1]|nr:hypothetical protein K474DRAFT_1714364 [Panus rudis PR-1116 ss-1]
MERPRFAIPDAEEHQNFVDGGIHDFRHALDRIPGELLADDPAAQEAIVQAISESRQPNQVDDSFETRQTNIITVNQLKRWQERGNVSSALHSLTTKCRYEVDDEFKYDAQDPNTMGIGMLGSNLDFEVVVGRQGLDAILPNAPTDLNFMFVLDMNNSHIGWSTTKAQLGIDPAGRMLRMGSYGERSVWLMLVPYPGDLVDEPPVEPGEKTGETQLSKKNYYRLVCFMAQCLHRAGIGGIYLMDLYPDLSSLDNIKNVTNLL